MNNIFKLKTQNQMNHTGKRSNVQALYMMSLPPPQTRETHACILYVDGDGVLSSVVL